MSTLVRNTGLFPSNSFFDDFITRDLFNWSSSDREHTLPQVNIAETDEDFRVEMAAPGMSKEDFKVELDNDTLTITSELNSEDNREVKYSRKEFSYQSFKRSFYLPNTVEVDKIEATYQDGLLNLVIPKKEEAKRKPVKTITIS